MLDFDGDIKASATEQLRHRRPGAEHGEQTGEVVLRLESGGMVMATAWRPRNWRASARPACR